MKPSTYKIKSEKDYGCGTVLKRVAIPSGKEVRIVGYTLSHACVQRLLLLALGDDHVWSFLKKTYGTQDRILDLGHPRRLHPRQTRRKSS